MRDISGLVNVNAPTANRIYGIMRDVVTPGDGSGTPVEASLYNDLYYALIAVLEEAGVVADDSEEGAVTSQFLSALKAVVRDSVAIPPVGTIVAWLPGYFADGSNGTYTGVAITLPANWKECNGSAINDADSPIFNGAGRYIANLTDDRFLMGDIAASAGGIGGNNSSAHTHSVPAHYHGMGTGADLNIIASGNHRHTVGVSGSSGAGNCPSSAGFSYTSYGYSEYATHTHIASDFSGRIGLVTGGVDGNASMTSGAASVTENRPQYLSVQYIQRIK